METLICELVLVVDTLNIFTLNAKYYNYNSIYMRFMSIRNVYTLFGHPVLGVLLDKESLRLLIVFMLLRICFYGRISLT
jgi:hypothetical protein